MILSDSSILAAMKRGEIHVDPFDRARLGPNSYDVRLGKNLLQYFHFTVPTFGDVQYIDAAENMGTLVEELPEGGSFLQPGTLYLGVTEEYTETSPGYVPFLDGTSSAGRLGIFIHATAGRGDAGFKGHWTLEISVVETIKIYPGMPLGQLYWMKVDGEVERPYGSDRLSGYAGGREESPMPKPSAMWKKLRRTP